MPLSHLIYDYTLDHVFTPLTWIMSQATAPITRHTPRAVPMRCAHSATLCLPLTWASSQHHLDGGPCRGGLHKQEGVPDEERPLAVVAAVGAVLSVRIRPRLARNAPEDASGGHGYGAAEPANQGEGQKLRVGLQRLLVATLDAVELHSLLGVTLGVHLGVLDIIRRTRLANLHAQLHHDEAASDDIDQQNRRVEGGDLKGGGGGQVQRLHHEALGGDHRGGPAENLGEHGKHVGALYFSRLGWAGSMEQRCNGVMLPRGSTSLG
mmetsp:Transcript_14655/g.37647  ORF Transcript_14655/g.37647 Transcript_14655/m.37647 type:complete len:265 (+) Transcript_14655:89-883(+)